MGCRPTARAHGPQDLLSVACKLKMDSQQPAAEVQAAICVLQEHRPEIAEAFIAAGELLQLSTTASQTPAAVSPSAESSQPQPTTSLANTDLALSTTASQTSACQSIRKLPGTTSNLLGNSSPCPLLTSLNSRIRDFVVCFQRGVQQLRPLQRTEEVAREVNAIFLG